MNTTEVRKAIVDYKEIVRNAKVNYDNTHDVCGMDVDPYSRKQQAWLELDRARIALRKLRQSLHSPYSNLSLKSP